MADFMCLCSGKASIAQNIVANPNNSAQAKEEH
jgi:hypothetical protein